MNGSLRGEIYSHAIVTEAGPELEFLLPYVIALIRINPGSRNERLLTMRVTDLDPAVKLGEQVHIGDEVEIVTRLLLNGGEQGLRVYGYAARMIEG